MGSKKGKLEVVKRAHAVAIILNGKKASDGRRNPYKQFTTKYYLWQTGFRNPKYKPSAPWIADAMARLGYPIKGGDT